MRNLLLGVLIVLITFIGCKAYGQCTSCTISVSGNSNQSFSLKKGDKLCFLSGAVYTGGVNRIHVQSEICIEDGAEFNPQYLNNWNGPVFNHGAMNLPSFSMNGNAALHNIGEIVMNNPNVNGNGIISNSDGASIQINGNLHLNGNISLSNDGEIIISNDFSLGGSTNFENNGSLEVNGNFNLNKNIENHGMLRVKGHMNNNQNGIHNFCMFISDRGFNNSGNAFKNEGFIWILGNGGNQFANSGTFHQVSGAQFRGINFANSGYITGAGDYYFSGNTANSAYVGHDGGGLNFYDASNTHPSNYFDQQAVAPHSSVSKNSFTPADTSSWGGGGNANAGDDQIICENETQLNAVGSIGKWSVVSGSANFADDNAPNTLITEIALGENILKWSEAVSCGTASDLVKITLVNEADTTVWTGSIDNNWHNSNNWTHCVPGQGTITMIPNTAISPEIKSGFTGYAHKIKVENNAKLRVKSNAKLIVAFRDEE